MNPNLPEKTNDIVLYTSKEIQEMFCLDKFRTNCLMNRWAFPSFKINNRFYVEDSALRKWLETNDGKRYCENSGA